MVDARSDGGRGRCFRIWTDATLAALTQDLDCLSKTGRRRETVVDGRTTRHPGYAIC